MPVMILFNEEGKTKVLANLKFEGSVEEEWDPLRVEVQIQNFSGFKVKAYNISEGLEEMAVEGNKIIIFPEHPSEPALPPPYAYRERRKVVPTHIAYVSSVDVACGICTYTKFLSEEVGRLFPVRISRRVQDVDPSSLIHLQGEFGIFPYSDELIGKRVEDNHKVVTWHTVLHNPGSLLEYYHTVDEHYDAHVVHNSLAKKYIKAYVRKPVHIIPHGTTIWSPVPKDEARKRLGLPLDQKVVFCFGFAAESKGFEEVVKVATKMKEVLFIISGAVHGIVDWHSKKVLSDLQQIRPGNVLILGRYLTEEEINLYGSASDCLLFNYKTPRFVSSASGAMHRVLAASKPIVCSVDNRLIELEDGHHALKYDKGDLDKMAYCLTLVLNDHDLASRLGRSARHLAEETSWRKMAEMHMDLYNDIVGEIFDPEWYDEEYFVGSKGGKPYVSENGSIKRWSYYNPMGEWLGAEPIMKVMKKLLNPRNMLDAGCGRGTFCAYAKDVGIEAYGIDFSPWAVDNPYPRAKGLIELGDVRNMRFPDASYDLVFASDIMEHIYEEDLDKVISEFQRVARKWIFYNISVTEEGNRLVLERGKLPTYFSAAVPGHVTVMPPSFWLQRLSNENWRLRDDLVKKFRRLVPQKIIQNWRLIIITEKIV